MGSSKTSWVFELIDKVTAPMRNVDASTKNVNKTLKNVTRALDDMDDATKTTAQRAIKSFNDLTEEVKKEEKQIDSLKSRLKSLGDTIDPLLKAQIDFDIKTAETKVRRYKEQLVEVQHELEEIEKAPNAEKMKANWGAAVVVANQAVELVNKAIDGLRFTTEINDLSTTIERFSGTSGKQLDDLTARAYKLGAVFKENPEEIAKAANAMTKQIGGSYEENFALIEAGFEKGANLNGDFIDQLKEYPTFINQVGLSQSQAIALMAKAGKDGIFSDKAIDSIKEADLSLREMGKPQVEALKGIGLEVKDLAGKTTFEAVQMISKAMDGATTNAKQLVLADIFKGAGEDAGLGWIEGLANVDLDINNIPSVESAGSSIRGWLADVKSSFTNTFGGIASSVVELAPVASGIASMIPILSSLTKVTWLQNVATKAMTLSTRILGTTILGTPIGWIMAAIAALVGGIMWLSDNVTGWGEFWKHTWEGAKLLFMGFVEGIKANFNTMINGLMIGINMIKLGWYKFKQAMGIGDSAENQKMLDQINADTEARKNSIVDGYKKAAELGIKAKDEFLKAGGSLKMKKKEEENTTSLVPDGGTGNFTRRLDGSQDPASKGGSGGSNLSGKGSNAGKRITMNLEIKNYFNIANNWRDEVDKISDAVTGKINDKLRDAVISL
jgi:hypothetical protein